MNYRIFIICIVVIVGFTSLYFYSSQSEELVDSNSSISKEDASLLLENAVLSFEKNQGQIDEEVLFLTKNRSSITFFTPTEVVYSLSQIVDDSDESIQLSKFVIRQVFQNPSNFLQVRGMNEQKATVNYFRGNDPEQWISGIPTFGGVLYQNMYNRIDLLYSGTSNGLIFRYTVKPGGDPSVIRQLLDGVESIDYTEDGGLVFSTGQLQIGLSAPIAYQEDPDGQRSDILVQYLIEEEIEGNTLQFSLGAYDETLPIVITNQQD